MKASSEPQAFLTLRFHLGSSAASRGRALARDSQHLPVEVRDGPSANYALQCEEVLGEPAESLPQEAPADGGVGGVRQERRIPLAAEGGRYEDRTGVCLPKLHANGQFLEENR